MRFTKIEIAGKPGSTAVIERAEGDEFIRVRFTENGQTYTHAVQADDEGDRYSMAEILQHAFEGRRGTRGDVLPYSQAIDLLGDP